MLHDLSIPLSLKPMEAEAVDELPRGKGWLYEPKYDGFRCLAFRDVDKVDLQSKKQKSLNRFFPEVAAGLAKLKADRFVLDGELIIPGQPFEDPSTSAASGCEPHRRTVRQVPGALGRV